MTSSTALAPTRLAGAWTRLSDKDGTPMGRLHAARRVNGALEPEALCGFRLPARALRSRPFAIFSTVHPKACVDCTTEARSYR